MRSKNIIICGDVHAYWKELNKLVSRRKPDIILQCGDFGFWPNIPKYDYKHIKNGDTKIYWCDGNHENHWELANLRGRDVSEIHPNVFYMKRGSILTLPDGRNVLFIGGADSIDKEYRHIGYNWFPEEIILYKDIENLPYINIDIVISHTCPTEVYNFLKKKYLVDDKFRDPSQYALSYVLDKYKPSLWYFGHFHINMDITIKNTKFTVLNYAGSGGKWWTTLKKKESQNV